jgi:choline dehydrogenase
MVSTAAFLALQWVTDEWARLLSDAAKVTGHLPRFYDQSLYAGYKEQQDAVRSLVAGTESPAYEVFAASWGMLAVSVMQPFSRGFVHARSSSFFENAPPIIDPRYCSHLFDCEMILQGLEFNDRLIGTSAMAALLPVPQEGFNTTDVQDRQRLNESMRRLIRSGFHTCGTTSMLPLDKGGVVDTSLRVYGTKNLRVVDAGVMPVIPDGHIQAALYAVAEKVRLLEA